MQVPTHFLFVTMEHCFQVDIQRYALAMYCATYPGAQNEKILFLESARRTRYTQVHASTYGYILSHAPLAQFAKAGIPCSFGAGGMGSIPANSDARNVPSFRRWRFEMKICPFFLLHIHTQRSQPFFTSNQALSALRCQRVSQPRWILSQRAAFFLSVVSSPVRPPSRLPRGAAMPCVEGDAAAAA